MKRSNKQCWAGLKRTTYEYNGGWCDPYIIYKGARINEWDAQDYLGQAFYEDMQEKNIIVDDNDFHKLFLEWIAENKSLCYYYLSELAYATKQGQK